MFFKLEGVTSSKMNEEVEEVWQHIEDLPIVLVLHLKCFDFKSNGGLYEDLQGARVYTVDLKIDASKSKFSSFNTLHKEAYSWLLFSFFLFTQ